MFDKTKEIYEFESKTKQAEEDELKKAGEDHLLIYENIFPEIKEAIEGNDKFREMFSSRLCEQEKLFKNEEEKHKTVDNISYFSKELSEIPKEEIEKLIPFVLSQTNLGIALLALLKKEKN